MDLRYLIVGGVVLCIGVPGGYALAQTDAVDDEAHSVTLVGCVMRESDFRDMYGPGQSGYTLGDRRPPAERREVGRLDRRCRR